MSRRWSWLLSAALVGAVAPTTLALAHGAKEETKVTMDKVPAAARDELLKKAGGAPILDVYMETGEKGETVYEAHVQKGNEVVGYKVDAKGAYLGSESEKKGEGEHK
jgi:uncharacterized membrane protein YkoI